jgi:crotonobetainyl-CoA:carnitine CoA-transferase CaiB-like acyl-CoA transferase
MTLPLAGVKVLDLGAVVFAPLASQWLADLGADVTKIEPPEGDSTRLTGPGYRRGMSALYLGCNRGKKGLVLDLKTEDGRAALQRLVAGADVLMHSIRPQKLAALGLDEARLKAANPGLIIAHLLGFGSDGPYAGLPAYDDIIQGMSGIADLMRAKTGEAQYLPTIMADKVSGLTAALAIVAAIVRRERTGEGAVIEVPMFETLVAFTMVEHLYGQQFVPALGPLGYPRVMAPWRRPFATADGHLCLMPYTDAHWRGFFQAAGAPEHLTDPRFADIGTRTAHIEPLYALVAALVAVRETAFWIEALEAAQVPCAPMIPLEGLADDPHLLATGFWQQVETPDGPLRMPANPVRFDGERLPLGRPPGLGEHSVQVLADAGFDAADIAALLASRAARGAMGPNG